MTMIKAIEPPDAYRVELPQRSAEFANGSSRRPSGDEIGSEGLLQFYGHISETFTNKLEWPNAYKTYNEIWRRDPTTRSVINAVKLLARQANWSAIGASDKPADRQAGEWLQSNLEDMSHTVEDFIDDAFSFLPFGWSSFEVCYKRRGGVAGKYRSQFDDQTIGWRKFAFRRQSSFERWEFDSTGGFGGWWQLAAPNYKLTKLPIENLLHFVSERNGGNPEGVCLLESIYEPWHYVKNLQIINGIGWQRTFVGLPVFRPEERLSSEDKATIKSVGEGITVDEKQYVTLPPKIGFSLESTNNSGAMSLLETIKMYRAMMLQVFLAEFLMQGQLGTGSFAAQSDKSDMFIMAVNGYLDKIAAVWNRFGVSRLFDFEANKIPGITALPRITHSLVRKPDLPELGQFISQIAQFITMQPDDEAWIREQAGMPEIKAIAAPIDDDQPADDATDPTPETGEGATDEESPAGASVASWIELQEFNGRDEDRTAIEQTMEETYTRFLRDQQKRISEAVDQGRNPAEDDQFWKNEEVLLLAVLLPALTRHINALTGFTIEDTENIFRIGIDWATVNAGALEWARQYAGAEVTNVTATTRRAVRAATANWIETGGELKDLINALSPTFGRNRAKNIAVTEITTAYVEGNIAAWTAAGIVDRPPEMRPVEDTHIGCYCWLTIEPRNGQWVWIWQTRLQTGKGGVCPICSPLHGKMVGIARETIAG